MGKGDKKTKRGKIVNGSYGVRRKRKVSTPIIKKADKAVKEVKPVEKVEVKAPKKPTAPKKKKEKEETAE
jgi:30S ribosomal protein S31